MCNILYWLYVKVKQRLTVRYWIIINILFSPLTPVWGQVWTDLQTGLLWGAFCHFFLLIDPFFLVISLRSCRGTAAVQTTANCLVLELEFFKRVIPDGSQYELRWGDPSQLFKGHDSSDVESYEALLPRPFGCVCRTCARMKERRETNRKTGRDRGWKAAWGINWSLFTNHKTLSTNPVQRRWRCPTKGQREPTTPLFFINTWGYLFSVSLTQSSLRHRESVHLSSTQAQCSMCLCFPEENCPPFLEMGVCFFWTNSLSNPTQFQSYCGCNCAKSLFIFHNTLNRENLYHSFLFLSLSFLLDVCRSSHSWFWPGAATVICGTFHLEQQTLFALWLCNRIVLHNTAEDKIINILNLCYHIWRMYTVAKKCDDSGIMPGNT